MESFGNPIKRKYNGKSNRRSKKYEDEEEEAVESEVEEDGEAEISYGDDTPPRKKERATLSNPVIPRANGVVETTNPDESWMFSCLCGIKGENFDGKRYKLK